MMEFTTMEIIGMVMHAVFIGVIIQINRQYKMEQGYAKEGERIYVEQSQRWKDKFDGEHNARLEVVGLNTHLSMQRDTLQDALLPFGNQYRSVLDKPEMVFSNLHGCLCDLDGSGVKPLLGMKMATLEDYVKAASLTMLVAADKAGADSA